MISKEDGQKDVFQFVKDSPVKATALVLVLIALACFIIYNPRVPVLDQTLKEVSGAISGVPNLEGVWVAIGSFQPQSLSLYSDGTAKLNWGSFLGVDHFDSWEVEGGRIYLINDEGRGYYNYRLEGGTLIINAKGEYNEEQWLFRRAGS